VFGEKGNFSLVFKYRISTSSVLLNFDLN